MKRWLSWAIWLYPAAWRTRYAREFLALLDDLNPRWRDLWDIFRGAILMQLSTPAVYLKLGAVTAVLGALVAGGVSFTLPERFVSSAVMRITPQAAPAGTPEQYRILATQRLAMMQQEILSRNSLAEMIQRPALDLYRRDRMRYPLEDIIETMRHRDMRIQILDAPRSADGESTAFLVSFESPDRQKAQAVVRALVTRFVDANVSVSRNIIAELRKSSSPDHSVPSAAAQQVFQLPAEPAVTPRPPLPSQVGAAIATNLEVLDPASLPDKPLKPDRLGIVAIGLGSGFALGLLIAFLRTRPWRWTAWMIVSGAAGGGAALGLAFSRELDPVPFACLGAAAALSLAAFLMRDRAAWRPAPYLKSACAFGVLSAILAGFVSFAIPERYVSTATLRIYQQGLYRLAAPDTTGAVPERFRQLQQEILSRGSLADLIQRPALDLYRQERQRYPLEDIVRDMRSRDIRIQAAGAALTSFTISFVYPNRFKAQAVVRELIVKFTELSYTMEKNLGHDRTQPGVILVEVLDPASDPQLPVWPNRLAFVATGLAGGILLGLLIAFLRRRPPGQAWAIVRLAAATGAAGGVIAAAIAFAIPSRYVSTAVLRVKSPVQSGDRVQQLMMEVLSRQNLSDELRRHVRIQSLEVGPHGQTTAFSVSFESTDPAKAYTTTQMLVNKFVEPNATYNPPGTDPANLEVLDGASIPNAPSYPARTPIAAAGLLAGVIAGSILGARRAATSTAS